MTSQTTRFVLVIVVLAQFAGTSLWFAGNAILKDLQPVFSLSDQSVANLTSSVQVGFILGTLVFALFSISDRYSPSKVFFICSLLGAFSNVLITMVDSAGLLFASRASVGFFLAGIYPVGMKISSDYHDKGLGKALGYLVGALVVGTAFPHLLKLFSAALDWRFVIYATSGMAVAGGLMVLLLVPDGPHRKQAGRVDIRSCFTVFKEPGFRSAAFGYFGHMWELYTVWAFVPLIIAAYNLSATQSLHVGLLSFAIIASGGVACVAGGYMSKYFGSKRTAFAALLVSGICCLSFQFFFQLRPIFFLPFLIIWGMAVVADSPQFSTLVAQSAPGEAKGTALTIVNSIGFAITIPSLQLMNFLVLEFDPRMAMASLAVGPILGLLALGSAKTATV